ncbi:MAG: DUF5686 and carboxypeptidase regulatory-like domain-containing protein [Flavipsychrobacter sp.]
MLRYISITLALLFVISNVQAAILKGRVQDTKGEPLPFATVFVKGSTIGTSANANADYSLRLSEGKYTIVCQYMGFTQAEHVLTIKAGETVTHNFSLMEQNLKLKTVTVKSGEDPAYGIIRQAIKRRKFHLEQQNSFQSSIYLKGVLRMRDMPDQVFGIKVKDADGESGGLSNELGVDSNGKGVLYLCEQDVDYYSKDNKSKTVIKSVTESGDPNGLGMSQVPSVISFYENNVNVLNGANPRGFISPISDNALRYYKYKYEGEFIENGYTVDRIKVTPRRLYEPLFTGTIYIVEKDWAIHSLDFLLTNKANLDQLDTLAVKQVYLPLRKDTWVIKNQVLFPTLTILGFDISGHFITVYDKQKVNEAIPDSVFDRKIVSEYLADANKKDSTYWVDKRPIPLEQDELKDYARNDSIVRRDTSSYNLDSLRRRGNRFSPTDLIIGGYTYHTKKYKNRLRINSALDGMVNYNTVEGIYVAPRINWRSSLGQQKSIELNTVARYGFANTRFNMFGKLAYIQRQKDWRDRNWQIGIEGGKYIFQYNQNSTVSSMINLFSTLAYSKNYMKLYERWTGAAFVKRNYGNGFSWYAKAGFQKRLPLANTSFYTWSNFTPARWTSNYPAELAATKWEQHNAALIKLGLSYQPGVKYIILPDGKKPLSSNKPTFTLQYEKGIPNILDSKTDFDKWVIGIKDDMNFKLLGLLSYNLTVGGFLNSNYVSLPDMKHIADNQTVLGLSYMSGFQLAPYYQYSNTAELYGEAHVEYNMNGLLTNKIPFFRKTQWYLLLGNNTLYTNDGSYYTEAFVSLDNIGFKLYRFLRVDLVKSWDDVGRNSIGFRVGLKLDGVISVGSSSAEKFDW